MRGLKKLTDDKAALTEAKREEVRAIIYDKSISDTDADKMIEEINKELVAKGVPAGRCFLTRTQQWI